jgi:hypothetical protein
LVGVPLGLFSPDQRDFFELQDIFTPPDYMISAEDFVLF